MCVRDVGGFEGFADLAVGHVLAGPLARRQGHFAIFEQVDDYFARADFAVDVARIVVAWMSVKPNLADRYCSHDSIIPNRLGSCERLRSRADRSLGGGYGREWNKTGAGAAKGGLIDMPGTRLLRS